MQLEFQYDWSKFNKTTLISISNHLSDQEQFDWNNPYYNLDENLNILQNILTIYDMLPSNIDLEFFCKLIENNQQTIVEYKKEEDRSKRKIIAEKLVLPEIKKFLVYYDILGNEYRRDYYNYPWDCYDKKWVKKSFSFAESEDYVSMWEGNNTGGDVIEYIFDEMVVQDIKEIQQDNIQESIIKKLIEKKTDKIFEGFDKKELIELKKLIDIKLKTLQ